MSGDDPRINCRKRYAAKHPERILASKRKWNNSERGRMARSAWQKSEKGKAWGRSEYHRTRAIVFNNYGPRCACCGEAELKFLTLDHVNGGGHQERKRIGSGTALFNKIIKAEFPPDYQILCMNCNFARGIYGACPHKSGTDPAGP